MQPMPLPVLQLQSVANEFVDSLLGAVPKALAGVAFLIIAYIAIRVLLDLVRRSAGRIYAGEPLIVDLVVLVAAVFLWFGAALTLLDILGLGDIAASLGTAAGFTALGVSYALSSMIADTVSGVYLLRDPDFNPGDTVTTDSVTGTVTAIDLRKSRIALESGDIVVMANRDVEKKWTKRQPSPNESG
ncbi:MAG: mechanosensitive ion channel [Halobacteriales archaeon]|nr:mechanosensitive ion channel [Halobacteriales archaeon]